MLTEIPKSREITKSLLKSRNFCKMGGEVGVFLFFMHAHIFTFEVPERALGAARRPTLAMAWATCCFPTFTLCSHVVYCTRVSCSMGLAMGYGRRYGSSADSMSVDLAVELGEGRLDSSVPLFFSCSWPLSRSSERDARTERLLTKRPSSA